MKLLLENLQHKKKNPRKLNLKLVEKDLRFGIISPNWMLERLKIPRASCGADYACDPKINGTQFMLTQLDFQCKKYPLRNH